MEQITGPGGTSNHMTSDAPATPYGHMDKDGNLWPIQPKYANKTIRPPLGSSTDYAASSATESSTEDCSARKDTANNSQSTLIAKKSHNSTRVSKEGGHSRCSSISSINSSCSGKFSKYDNFRTKRRSSSRRQKPGPRQRSADDGWHTGRPSHKSVPAVPKCDYFLKEKSKFTDMPMTQRPYEPHRHIDEHMGFFPPYPTRGGHMPRPRERRNGVADYDPHQFGERGSNDWSSHYVGIHNGSNYSSVGYKRHYSRSLERNASLHNELQHSYQEPQIRYPKQSQNHRSRYDRFQKSAIFKLPNKQKPQNTHSANRTGHDHRTDMNFDQNGIPYPFHNPDPRTHIPSRDARKRRSNVIHSSERSMAQHISNFAHHGFETPVTRSHMLQGKYQPDNSFSSFATELRASLPKDTNAHAVTNQSIAQLAHSAHGDAFPATNCTFDPQNTLHNSFLSLERLKESSEIQPTAYEQSKAPIEKMHPKEWENFSSLSITDTNSHITSQANKCSHHRQQTLEESINDEMAEAIKERLPLRIVPAVSQSDLNNNQTFQLTEIVSKLNPQATEFRPISNQDYKVSHTNNQSDFREQSASLNVSDNNHTISNNLSIGSSAPILTPATQAAIYVTSNQGHFVETQTNQINFHKQVEYQKGCVTGTPGSQFVHISTPQGFTPLISYQNVAENYQSSMDHPRISPDLTQNTIMMGAPMSVTPVSMTSIPFTPITQSPSVNPMNPITPMTPITPIGVYENGQFAFPVASVPVPPVVSRPDLPPRPAQTDPRPFTHQPATFVQPPPVFNIQTYCMTVENDHPFRYPESNVVMIEGQCEKRASLMDRVDGTLKEVQDCLKTGRPHHNSNKIDDMADKILKLPPNFKIADDTVQSKYLQILVDQVNEARKCGKFSEHQIRQRLSECCLELFNGGSSIDDKNVKNRHNYGVYQKKLFEKEMYNLHKCMAKQASNITGEVIEIKEHSSGDDLPQCDQGHRSASSNNQKQSFPHGNNGKQTTSLDLPLPHNLNQNASFCYELPRSPVVTEANSNMQPRRASMGHVNIGTRISYFESNACMEDPIRRAKK